MQSSLEIFCAECGAANMESATLCVACQGQMAARPVARLAVPIPQTTLGAPPAGGSPQRGALLAGRYRVLREIGQGGFGAVYKARDLHRRGRVVAIKQIDLGLAGGPREMIIATDAFHREIAFLSTLSHPSLPKISDHFTDPGHWYLVMEYISGRTLEEELQRSRRGYLPTRRVLQIGLQVLDILSYLHRQHPPVIFRDLKPANIMLTRRGQLYLIDFGIARRFAVGKHRDTGPLGSPGYAAPEQYGRAQTDERSDIYGLGATLQTLLSGRDPLELRQGLPSLRPDPIPAELQALLDSMLERDPEGRPQRVEVVEERVAGWVRRVVDWPAIARGAGIALALWTWYALLRVGIVLIEHDGSSQLATTPFKVRAFLVLLNLFPPAVLATALYQGVSLVFRERSKQIQAVCVLILLVLLFLLAWLLGLAPLFKNYPFHSVAP
jgi:hypothetical protein